MQNANRSLQKFGRKMQQTGKALSVGLTLPIVALGAKSIVAFDKQAKAIAQVEAGLKSTGNTANKTSKQLQDAAAALQENSLFGDEEILKDVTAQLLTFTNIAGNQFDRTQQAALDLATRLDGDLKSASIQLGKALNDPVANLSALSRSGIQFSEDQKKVISSFAKTGKLAEAQTIILDELEKQYGGAAKAASEAGLGPFKQLGNSIGDLTEDFGKIISEAIIPFVNKIKGVVTTFKSFDDQTKKIIVVVGGLLASLGPVLTTIGFLATNVIPGLISALAALRLAVASNPIGLLVTAAAALSATVLVANSRFTSLTDATKEYAAITTKAASNIADEKVALETLLRTANNERLSKERRIEAINELNRIVPQYNNELSLETINTDKAKKATDKYVKSLLLKAKVQAAQEKLVEVERELLDLQLGNADAVEPSFWQNLGNVMKSYGNTSALVASTGKTVLDNLKEEESQLTSLQGKIISFLTDNQKLVDLLQEENKVLDHNNTELEENEGRIKAVVLANNLLAQSAVAVSTAYALVGKEAERVGEIYTQAQALALQTAATLSERIGPVIEDALLRVGSGLSQMIAGFAEGTAGVADIGKFILGTLGDLMIRLGEIALQTAIGLLGIKAAFESLNPALAAAAGVALIAFGSLIKGKIQDAPVALAQGGLAFGNTLSLIGDNRNAAFDPEVVAPLSKLKDFISPGDGSGANVNVGIEGLIRGRDLELVVSRVVDEKLRMGR